MSASSPMRRVASWKGVNVYAAGRGFVRPGLHVWLGRRAARHLRDGHLYVRGSRRLGMRWSR